MVWNTHSYYVDSGLGYKEGPYNLDQLLDCYFGGKYQHDDLLVCAHHKLQMRLRETITLFQDSPIPQEYIDLAECGNRVIASWLIECYERGLGVNASMRKAFVMAFYAAPSNDVHAVAKLAEYYYKGNGVDVDEKQAFRLFNQAAEQGCARSQYFLGECFFHGKGQKKDFQLAARWFRKAAEQEIAEACYSLGLCYANAKGVTRNDKTATRYYRKAAKQGHIAAQKVLGDCYFHGRGVSQNISKAVNWYRKASEQGDSSAQYNLGSCHYKGQGVSQDYVQAVNWYRKAAEQGNAEAQCNLGFCYDMAQGVSQDFARAAYWYKKAAEQGNMYAQNNLGLCHQYSKGVSQDYEQAVYWYMKAAEQGHASAGERLLAAQNFLADSYFHGSNGKEKNYVQAVYWYRKVAAIDNSDAQNKLGMCYKNGHGVLQDYAQAVYWYRKAARLENHDAQCNLGLCYENGQGVPQDYKQAVYWYLKAAEQEDARAQCNLGLCYENGQGVLQDYKRALHWYLKAARQGYIRANTCLCLLYKNGLGVVQNYNYALYWYQQAAMNGDVEACYILGNCYHYGKGVERNFSTAVKWYECAGTHTKAVQALAEVQKLLADDYFHGLNGKKQDFFQAVKLYHLSAAKGNAEARFCLGNCYYKGQGVQKDYTEAVKQYESAGKHSQVLQILPIAQKLLADDYFHGLNGKRQDLSKAVKLYRKSSSKGHFDAAYCLGNCFYQGKGVSRDYAAAVNCYKSAGKHPQALQMLPLAQKHLADEYFNGSRDKKQDFQKAVKLYRKAALKGNVEARFCLGNCYYQGKGVRKDYAEALKYYKLAGKHPQALQMLPMVQKHLADEYFNGRNGKGQDFAKAVKLYRKSAARGNSEANFCLGYCYFHGIGVKRDYVSAFKHYKCSGKKEALWRIPIAQKFLADEYFNGLNGKMQDYVMAVNWYSKAVARILLLHSASLNDNWPLHTLLSLELCSGYYLENMESRAALKCYGLSNKEYDDAASVYCDAFCILGKCYHYGRGAEIDYAKAEKLYELAGVCFKDMPVVAELAQVQKLLADEYYYGLNGKQLDFTVAVYWYEKASKNGNDDARYSLGSCYEFGTGVAQNYAKAAYFYEAAGNNQNAQKSLHRAQKLLADEYYFGLNGRKQDLDEAFRLYCITAEQGNADAQNNLGDCYSEGKGVAKDYSQALALYRQAADQGHINALCNLGLCHEYAKGVEQDYEQAVEWYRKAAFQGDARAQFYLGKCYFNGQGVPKDYEQTLNWYRKSADQGYADAQFYLGNCYHYGIGVDVDYLKAVEWYCKAAEQGNARSEESLPVAQKLLADEYYFGLNGRKQDLAEAVRLYGITAEQGDADAQNILGDCYCEGKGVEQDYEQAADWYRKSAEQGHVEAQFKLGNCYHYGNGVEIDYEKAIKWYEAAGDHQQARQALPLAQKLLADEFYHALKGRPRDLAQAVKWYGKAAGKGNAEACYGLGRCYHYGNGVGIDYEKAIKWYEAAGDHQQARQALPLAQKLLADVFFRGSNGKKQDYVKAARLYHQSAASGNAEAGLCLGNCYHYGKGVAKDYAEAVKRYESFGERPDVLQSLSFALYDLAQEYAEGNGRIKNLAKALELYERSAKLGSQRAREQITCARYDLAEQYYFERKFSNAVELYKLAAAQGHIASHYKLGLCYAKALGVDQDSKRAAECYKVAADDGVVDAQYELGRCYQKGFGVGKDFIQAMRLFGRARDNGHKKAAQEYKKNILRIWVSVIILIVLILIIAVN